MLQSFITPTLWTSATTQSDRSIQHFTPSAAQLDGNFRYMQNYLVSGHVRRLERAKRSAAARALRQVSLSDHSDLVAQPALCLQSVINHQRGDTLRDQMDWIGERRRGQRREGGSWVTSWTGSVSGGADRGGEGGSCATRWTGSVSGRADRGGDGGSWVIQMCLVTAVSRDVCQTPRLLS